MTNFAGLLIESVVALLLVTTIVYCVMLNRRLQKFRADEQSLRGTIAELITATEIAERAIAGLKLTVRDCDHSLGGQLRSAEGFTARMAEQIEAGEQILDRLAQITIALRPPQVSTSAPDPRSLAAAAGALAERSRSRVSGLAA